jgi:hypothetical protein
VRTHSVVSQGPDGYRESQQRTRETMSAGNADQLPERLITACR